MQNKYWNVLVVDDEDDVIMVTKIALKRMSLYGLPIKIHAVSSKEAAINWLKTNPEAKALHMAIVDVVMETNLAGLELCEYIRKEEKNMLTRIVLRTGQPGKAAEREVVDAYDITAYLAKTDATEEKLYSSAKCCIKECYASSTLAMTGKVLTFLSAHILSQKMFMDRMRELFHFLTHDAEGRPVPSLSPHFCFMWGDADEHVGAGMFEDRRESMEIRDRLLTQPMTSLNAQGDAVVNFADPVGRAQDYPVNTSLFVLPASADGKVPRQHVMMGTSTWPLPDFALTAMHSMLVGYRPLYMLAKKSGG